VGIGSSSRRLSVTTKGHDHEHHPTHGTTRTRAWSVADNLARIEFTPDDLERLELF